jgi:hypothetical protein
MDELYESLLNNKRDITVCLEKITYQEQYELIRILVENPSKFKICKHGLTSKYTEHLLSKCDYTLIDCSTTQS